MLKLNYSSSEGDNKMIRKNTNVTYSFDRDAILTIKKLWGKWVHESDDSDIELYMRRTLSANIKVSDLSDILDHFNSTIENHLSLKSSALDEINIKFYRSAENQRIQQQLCTTLKEKIDEIRNDSILFNRIMNNAINTISG